MPLYEYECRGCTARFEVLVMSASPPVTCPSCGGRKVEKQFSTFGTRVSPGARAAAADCDGPCAGGRGECPREAAAAAGAAGAG